MPRAIQRKLVLSCRLSLGDIVALTAAVRDLHRCYPGAFLTDVQTSCGEVWLNNPHLTQLDERDPEVTRVACEYPLIEWSNQVPYHFLHGFIDHLSAQLGIEIKATEFHGDIHLSTEERRRPSQVAERVGREIPYWLILAGGKHDLTIKWWDAERYQQVVDHFRGRIQFVQLGSVGCFHPRLEGTLDFRGATSIRDLIHLVYRAQGVLCGVTGLMHLAAAVPRPSTMEGLRPCVVVAGGREPVHWEAYPGHEFLHSIGQLNCCASGGCWRSRTVPLGDGDPRDRAPNLCVDVRDRLPRCMDLITAERVIESIERFLEGRKLPSLPKRMVRHCETVSKNTEQVGFEEQPLVAGNVRAMLDRAVNGLTDFPGRTRFKGRGVVICAGGVRFFTCAYVAIRRLRQSGCRLPVEVWYLGAREMTAEMKRLLLPYDVRCVDALSHPNAKTLRRVGGWELKPHALLWSRFEQVLFLDADNVVARDPSDLFESAEFRQHAAIFWPDSPGSDLDPKAIALCGLSGAGDRSFESGQIMVDKSKCWKALELTCWFNQHSDFFYPFTRGDKETFRLAFHRVGKSYAMPSRSPEGEMKQYDFKGRLLFQHRNTDKWSLVFEPKKIPGFRFESECEGYLAELRGRWKPRVGKGESPLPLIEARFSHTSGTEKANQEHPARHRTRGRGRKRTKHPSSASPLTLVMLYDDSMKQVGRVTSKAWREYAERHGYEFVLHSDTLDPERHPAWSKIKAVEQQLVERGGVVMWVDADTLPMNLRLRADRLIPADREAVFATDFNGLNSGVFLVRHSAWSLEFLRTVYWLRDVSKNPDDYGDKWEQNTIKAVLDQFRAGDGKVELLPERVMNSSLASYEPGDFLLHLGGLSNRERLKRLKDAASWVIR